MRSDLSLEDEGQIIASEFVLAENIRGEDEEDSALLHRMSKTAQSYISSFAWCDSILNSYFAGGVGGIFAMFFFHIRPSRKGIDPWIWIVVGDVPPAYLPVSDCKSPAQVFRTYIKGMGRWAELAQMRKRGTPDQGVPPVSVPATPDWAEELNKRLRVLETIVRPFFEEDSGPVN